MPRRVDALISRLEALEAGGGARFDPPGCRCVRALLDRGETLASDHLLGRAEARLEAIERALAADRASVGAALDELAARGEAGTTALREALERGDVSRARRGVRRIRALFPLARGERGAREAAGERYRRASAEFSAAVTIARARDTLPADAGPYNGTLVATHTLDRLATTSPTYLHTLVERLEDLAALQSLAPPPAPAPKAARKRTGSTGAKPTRKRAARGRRKAARSK